MDSSEDRTRVVPYQLCPLCRQLFERCSLDIFWTDKSYRLSKLDKYWMFPDPEILGDIAKPLEHQDCLTSLEESAAGGCHVCAIFHEKLPRRLKTCGGVQLYVRLLRREIPGCPFLLLEMYESCPPDLDGFGIRWTVELRRNRCTTHHEDHCHWFMDNRTIDSHEERYKWCTTTDSNEGYDLINHWLQQCIDGHDSCRRGLDSVRPTRLLDLGATPSDQNIRLVLTKDVGMPSYATLSYRWGRHASIRLTKSTYEDLCRFVVLESLPRTIQDAVKICRRLSVQYLWVDALCIVQDDGEELAREIAQMGSIYAGSLVTVAAADSNDSTSGIFRARNPLEREDCIISSADQDYVLPQRSRCPIGNFHDNDVNQSKLNARGWVYQERVLSPSTVHFTANEVIWECRKRFCCYTCGDQKQDSIGDDFFNRPPKDDFLKLHDLALSGKHDASFQNMWSVIVERYTSTELSSANDKLSALAGVAQLAYGKLNYQASYGLWLDTFLEELLWASDHLRPYALPRKGGILDLVPSWSWASTRSNVRRPYHRNTKQKEIYSALTIKAPPATPFAQITRISESWPGPVPIRLQSWLRACQVCPRLSNKNDIWGWSLIPMTEVLKEEVDNFITDAWAAIEDHDGADDSTLPGQVEGKQRNQILIHNGYQLFYPDDLPKQRDNLFSVLLKRVIKRTTNRENGINTPGWNFDVVDHGIVCEVVDLSLGRFRRVGYFSESMLVGGHGIPSYARTNDKHLKSDVAEDLGLHCQSNGSWGVRSSLFVDAKTVAQLLGLTLDDIEDYGYGPGEDPSENLLWVQGELSLFGSGYEECEVEII